MDEWPSSFHYATEWPRADEGLKAIRDWIVSAKNPRLVVVDVLAMFRPRSGNRDNQYEADYHAIQGLQALAGEFNVSSLSFTTSARAAATWTHSKR